jgi:hypothetical protein
MFNMLRAMDAYVGDQDGGGAVEPDIELCQCCLDAGEMTTLASTECGQCGARICDGCLENDMCCECRAQRERDAVTCHTCGAPVESDVLARQTMADGSLMWPQPFCRAHLLAGLRRLDAELRQPGKDSA